MLNLTRHLMTICMVLALAACNTLQTPSSKPNDFNVASAWADHTLHIMKRIQGTPTSDSRLLGYVGLTMYESVVHSDAHYQSLASQLSGHLTLPQPKKDIPYDWNIVLNSAQAQIHRKLFEEQWKNNPIRAKNYSDDEQQFAQTQIERINTLEKTIEQRIGSPLDAAYVYLSKQFGQSIANAIFEWSQTDHSEDLTQRFSSSYTPLKTGKGTWVPPDSDNSQVPGIESPLYPQWGSHRTFHASNSTLPIPPMPPYSESPDSEYYQQFKAVYDESKKLTDEKLRIAAWWADDPAKYYSPPAHSYYLANTVVKKAQPPLVKAAQTYAAVGMATADAFTVGWKIKFHYYSERPNTYITRVIDAKWQPIWPEPPFPAFISGHGVQSGAATQVLANLYGDAFELIDDAYQGRDDEYRYNEQTDKMLTIEFNNRAFHSFSQIAQEIADSRLYGGIHTPMDNAYGLDTGRQIGANISQLRWTR
ncbi:MAG: vanadium-dependent haloperoxidase [Formosimonas sp.]